MNIVNNIFIIVFSVIIVSTNSYAKKEDFRNFDWDEITAEDWNVQNKWIDEKPDAIMLFEKYIDDHSLIYDQIITQYQYTRIIILTEKGKENSKVEFTYFPRLDIIPVLKARTTFRDGRVYELSKEEILENEIKIGEKGKSRKVSFTFPNVDANCIIDYCIVVQQKKLPNLVPTYFDRYIQKKIPLNYGEYVWYPAIAFGPSKNYVNLGKSHYTLTGSRIDLIDLVKEERGSRNITLKVRDIPAWRKEIKSLSDSATYLKIWRFYGDSPDEAFNKFSKHNGLRTYSFNKKDSLIIHDVAEKFRDLDCHDDRVKAVYSWVQDSIINTTYHHKPPSTYRTKKGKKIKKFKVSKKPTDALKRRYGHYKDIELLFYHILKDLDIDVSWMHIVRRNEDIFVKDAGIWQFDRSILVVKNPNGKLSFHSPGEYGLPYGTLNWGEESVDGLVGSDPYYTTRTSFTPPDRNRVIRVFSLQQQNDNVIRGKMTEDHHGHKARLCQTYLVKGIPEEIQKSFADSLEQFLPGVKYTIDDINIDTIKFMEMNVTYSLDYGSLSLPDSGVVKVNPFNYAPDSENIFEPPERYNEIMFKYAYTSVDSIHLTLKEDWIPISLPSDTIVITDAGECKITYISKGNEIIATRIFTINKPRYSVAEYPALRELFVARNILSNNMIECEVK